MKTDMDNLCVVCLGGDPGRLFSGEGGGGGGGGGGRLAFFGGTLQFLRGVARCRVAAVNTFFIYAYRCNVHKKHTYKYARDQKIYLCEHGVWRNTRRKVAGCRVAAVCTYCGVYTCAIRCNTLQHTATHCNTLQHTATHCNTLQHTAYCGVYTYTFPRRSEPR